MESAEEGQPAQVEDNENPEQSRENLKQNRSMRLRDSQNDEVITRRAPKRVQVLFDDEQLEEAPDEEAIPEDDEQIEVLDFDDDADEPQVPVYQSFAAKFVSSRLTRKVKDEKPAEKQSEDKDVVATSTTEATNVNPAESVPAEERPMEDEHEAIAPAPDSDDAHGQDLLVQSSPAADGAGAVQAPVANEEEPRESTNDMLAVFGISELQGLRHTQV